MTWGSVPQFAAGSLVSAIHLDQMGANIQYLYSGTQCLWFVGLSTPTAGTPGMAPQRMPGGTAVEYEVAGIYSTIRTAPSSGTVVFDVNRNGTTLYTTQGNRPTRLNGDGTGVKTHLLPNVVTLHGGDTVSVDIDSAPGTGLDALVQVEFVEVEP